MIRWRTGCEGRISCVKRDFGLNRTRTDGLDGARSWCGHGILADNLVRISGLIQAGRRPRRHRNQQTVRRPVFSYPEPDQIGPYMTPPPGLRPVGPASDPLSVNVADLAPTVGGALIALSGVNNGTDRAYQVVFEENDDGRRRASVVTYTRYYDESQEVVIHVQHLFVNGSGEVIAQTVSYGDPDGTALPVRSSS